MFIYSRFSKRIQVVIPICIAGFPYLLFEEAFRRSVDTLPIYGQEEECGGGEEDVDSDHDEDELEQVVQTLVDTALQSAIDS